MLFFLEIYDGISSIYRCLFSIFFFRNHHNNQLVSKRQKEKSKQTDGSPLALFNLFIERTKEMLHIVLAMSPIGDAFRNRLRKFPSLISCCTIDWFQVSLPLYLVFNCTSTLCTLYIMCNHFRKFFSLIISCFKIDVQLTFHWS